MDGMQRMSALTLQTHSWNVDMNLHMKMLIHLTGSWMHLMPKSNDEEIELRRAAIHSGTLEAANVPLQTAKLALDLLASLPALAQTGNSNAVTDVGVGFTR